MNRAKHVTMLIFKILFIILCFAIASVFTVLQSIPLNRFDNLKNKIGLDECEILVMDDNGASLSYEVVDDKIIFDIKQNLSLSQRLPMIVAKCETIYMKQ